MVEAREKLVQEEKERRLKQFQANVKKRAQLIRKSQAMALRDLSQNATRFEAEAIKRTAHPNATIRAPQVGLAHYPADLIFRFSPHLFIINRHCMSEMMFSPQVFCTSAMQQ